jgi:iron complex transport system substrate-binding protein
MQEVFVKAPRTVLLFLLLWAAAYLGAQELAFPLHVVDDTGAAVTLRARPVRIVSLTLATDEMLLDMVEHDRLQGVTTFASDPAISNVANRVVDIPHSMVMNVETILSVSPDLALVADWSDAGPVQQLRNAGVSVYQMSSGLTIASIEQKITRLALLIGEQRKGREMVATMEHRLSAVARRVSTLPLDKRLRVIDYATWGSAQGRGSSWDEMLSRAGLADGVGDLASDEWGQVPMSREKLLQLDPDILVLPGWVYGNPQKSAAFYTQIMTDPALKGLRAVRSRRVYVMPERLKSTTSQYIAAAVEWLARTAYPDAFR